MKAIGVVCLACCQLGPVEHAPPKPSLADEVIASDRRMHERFAAANAVESAIAYGDLDRAREGARKIADLDEPHALPNWRPYVRDVRIAAFALTRTRDLVSAARHAADLGERCARCHTAAQARIVFPSEARPAASPQLAVAMYGHQWAVARMWEGLIGPSDERWLEGAEALQAAPLTYVAAADGAGMAERAQHVHVLAQRAQRAGADRASAFGELLATCAGCHAEVRDR